MRSLGATADRLCAGTQGDGVFCRDLSSATAGWVPLGPQGTVISWIWIDPQQPDLIFAAAESSPQPVIRLYRTVDGGRHWRSADGGSSNFTYSVHGVPGTPTLYRAGAGVLRSDDLGDSWEQVLAVGGLLALDVAPTDPNTLYAGGEGVIFEGYTYRSRDGGHSWQSIWDSWSGGYGDNQTAAISAHPLIDGLVLTGHEGFVLRTTNYGGAFTEVLSAPARFFLDWDGGNPARAYAAGSPNSPNVGHAFVSRDRGQSWSAITGALAGKTILRLEADERRVGVAYVAAGDGVYRFYGGGLPLCMDTRAGVDDMALYPGACPPIAAPGPAILGDAIVGEIGRVSAGATVIDLGEVECVVDDADIAFTTLEPPEPAPGTALFLLARLLTSTGYGASSDGRPRLPALGDCVP